MPPILITLPGHDGRQYVLQLFGEEFYKEAGQWDKTKGIFYPSSPGMTPDEMDRWSTYLKRKVR